LSFRPQDVNDTDKEGGKTVRKREMEDIDKEREGKSYKLGNARIA
jgi:hypothetical protein